MAVRLVPLALLLVALCACSNGDGGSKPLRITAVGDSVMVGAAQDLERELPGIEVHAKEGRQFAEGIEVVRGLREDGAIGDVALVDLGTNGPITQEQVDEMLALLDGAERVVFVNLRVPRSWEGENNAILDATSARYENVALVDWHGASEGHPEYFWDGVHLTPDGARAFALLVSGEIED